MARGVDGRAIFMDDEDRRRFCLILSQLRAETGCTYLAYCLMGNHFHLAIKVANIPLSRVLQRLLTRYSKTFNLRHGRSGHLFQDRFRSVLCLDDRYLIGLIRYIHLNPVRANLVATAMDWTWSSRRNYAGQAGPLTIEPAPGLEHEIGAALEADGEEIFEPWPGVQDATPEMLRSEPSEMTSLAELASRIVSKSDLSERDLKSSNRKGDVAAARKRLIVAAVDSGHSLSEIARWLRRTPGTIHATLYGRQTFQKNQKPDTVKSLASGGSGSSS